MIIGVPRETHRHEHRVGLNPFAVSRLVRQGHSVVVESGAGQAAHFTDENYKQSGARIVYSGEEAHKRADLVCSVGLISPDEVDQIGRGSTICAFHHLAVASRETIQRLTALEATVVGYEIIEDARGDRPVLIPMSDMAGQMAVNLGAHYLQNEEGGRGILLGNVSGIPPATVVILGAGTAGHAAARQALAHGAHVIVIDMDPAKLRLLHREFSGGVVTVLAGFDRLERYTAIADVLIGAVLIPGGRAPFLITEKMVQGMKPGSFICDLSIDQGGCVETSRPTSIADPVFKKHGVIHYCVPNMTANVARTASRALAHGALPYVMAIASRGLEQALRDTPGLAAGLYMLRGKLVNATVGEIHDIPSLPWERALEGGAGS
jgi:alanine dehydrogenase